jgi:hypothetical protein
MLKYSILGLCAAAAHLALLALSVTLILSRQAPDWPTYWLIYLALDFPVSLGVIPLAWMFPAASAGPLSDFPNFWWPLAFHGIVGTFWWYVVGWAIGRRVTRWRRGETSEPDEQGAKNRS